MNKVKVRFDGRVFVPEEPVELPKGCVLELPLPEQQERPLLDLVKALELLPSDPDWPPDMAAQHDHYLYGTPKRP